jgi:hypothetical protein
MNMQSMNALKLSLTGFYAVFLVAGCATSDAFIASKEVAEYDSFVASLDPTSVLEKVEARANEPYVLAGEDVSGIRMTVLSLFKRLGDSDSEQMLLGASVSQRSAVRLFIKPEHLGSKFRKTRSLIERIPIESSWPAVRAEEIAF